MRFALFVLVFTMPLPALAQATLQPDRNVVDLLEPIREKHKLPGMTGAILHKGKIVAIGSVGVRRIDAKQPLTINDRIHLGSCTKSMTATRIAMLVEQGKLKWDSTIIDVFADLKKDIHPDFQKVTLMQLLTHRSGMPANGPWWELGQNLPTTVQRLNLVKKLMGEKPQSEPGTKYLYSNAGYAVAGLMAEKVSGQSWEVLMKKGLFEPLGMTTAGFGAPGTRNRVDQPWGHERKGDKLVPTQHDNAAALGPAGTVHCSLADWGKYAQVHLRPDGIQPKLLSAASIKTLHTPPSKADYAAGWLVVQRGWAGGEALTHSGSNTYWFCTIWLAPNRELGIMTATNLAGDTASQACDQAASGLIGYFYKSLAKK